VTKLNNKIRLVKKDYPNINTLCIIWFECSKHTGVIFIVENILTKETLTFKDLEEIA
jgi:hypothetical protein